MGARFRRSMKLAPGLRINFSASGASLSMGGRGSSVTIGKRGAYANVGIPGTGLSFRQRIDSGSRQGRSAAPVKTTHQFTVSVATHDDGTIFFKDSAGNVIGEELASKIKKQNGPAIRELIQQKCDEINGQIEALAEIHHYTPSPTNKPVFHPEDFSEQKPQPPTPKTLGFFAGLFKKNRERLDAENQSLARQYEDKLADWQARKEAFAQEQAVQKKFIEQDIYSSIPAMEAFLEGNLQAIEWPRETLLVSEIGDDGSKVFIDVDLPGIEDMPTQTASVPQRGFRLVTKDMSQTQIQRIYMGHIHGVGFRIIGEVLSCLPKAQEVVLSAFTQRPDKATGNIQSDYLYSVIVKREAWSQLNFDKLPSIDVVEALAQFDLRRNMTKTGVFKAVEPF